LLLLDGVKPMHQDIDMIGCYSLESWMLMHAYFHWFPQQNSLDPLAWYPNPELDC